MKMETPLPTAHQLDRVAGQFAHWRRTRSHPSERIPQRLWKQAAALAQVLPHCRVAQRLRLSPNDLKKHMVTQRDAKPTASPHPRHLSKCRLRPPGPWRQGRGRSSLSVPMGHVCASGARSQPRLWPQWYGPFWRRTDASTQPAKPYLFGHPTGRFPQRSRFPSRRLPTGTRRAASGRGRLCVSKPRGNGSHNPLLRRTGILALYEAPLSRPLHLVANLSRRTSPPGRS